jgi:hypothetical protein
MRRAVLLPAGNQLLLPEALLMPLQLSHSMVPSSAWHLSHMP